MSSSEHKNDQKSITIAVLGGLGNQLFQIATALEYARKYNRKLFLFPIPGNLRPFYWDSILQAYQSHLVNDDGYDAAFREPSFRYTEIPEFQAQRLSVYGYYQSSKYFPTTFQEFKNSLVLPSFHSSLQFQDDIKDKQIVIVHARRGDYLNAISFHGITSDEYYQNALKVIKEKVKNPIFVLMSDDEKFWEMNTVFKEENVLVWRETDELKTLSMMTKGNHFILANSSFSWWGAMLSDRKGLVIAPKSWFGQNGPRDTDDIYEPEWIRI